MLDADGRGRVRRVAEIGDCGQGGEAVAGQVDLRDELDAELGRSPHPPADVAGGVGAAGGLRPRSEEGGDREPVAAPRADLGERRVGGDRHPPGLVVGEVEVEPVEPPPCGDVDEPLDVDRREELAGEVDVQPAPLVDRDLPELVALLPDALGAGRGRGTPSAAPRPTRR